MSWYTKLAKYFTPKKKEEVITNPVVIYYPPIALTMEQLILEDKIEEMLGLLSEDYQDPNITEFIKNCVSYGQEIIKFNGIGVPPTPKGLIYRNNETVLRYDIDLSFYDLERKEESDKQLYSLLESSLCCIIKRHYKPNCK